MLDPEFKINVEMAIKRMLAVALHIRDCERCHRIYSATFEASMEAKPEVHGGIWEYYPPHSYAYYPPHSYKVLEACIRDLRDCERWPNDV